MLVLLQISAPHAEFVASWVLLISPGAGGTLGGCCYRPKLDVSTAFCGTQPALPALLPCSSCGARSDRADVQQFPAVGCGRTVPPCPMEHWHVQGRAECPTGVAMCLLSPFVVQCPPWHTGTHGHHEPVGAHTGAGSAPWGRPTVEGLVGTGDGESSAIPGSLAGSPQLLALSRRLCGSLTLPEEHGEAEVREGAGIDLKGDVKVGD